MSEDRYSRPKSAKGTNLDYDKVDWAALERELNEAPRGEKKRVIWDWAIRLRCSKDTLYQGLRKHREGATRWQESES